MNIFSKKHSTAEPRPLVTFELSHTAFEALKMDAKKLDVRSHHQRAKQILTDYLFQRDTAELQGSLAILESKLMGVAELIRRDTYAVLVHAAKLDNEVAKAWIRDCMYEPLER